MNSPSQESYNIDRNTHAICTLSSKLESGKPLNFDKFCTQQISKLLVPVFYTFWEVDPYKFRYVNVSSRVVG